MTCDRVAGKVFGNRSKMFSDVPCTFSSICISLAFHTSVQVTFCGGLCFIFVVFKCHSSCFVRIYCCILFLLFHFSWLGSHLMKSPARNVVCFNISPCIVYEPTTCHSYDLYLNSARQLHDLNFNIARLCPPPSPSDFDGFFFFIKMTAKDLTVFAATGGNLVIQVQHGFSFKKIGWCNIGPRN